MPDRPPYPPQPAQPPGKTYLSFSPSGHRLLVAGCANYARSFRTNDDGESDVLDDIRDDNLAAVAGDDYAILGSEDGAVCEYSVPEGRLKEILTRCSLPIRDVTVDPAEQWVAVASDEVEVKIVKRGEIEKIHTLRAHPKPVKHVSFDPKGRWLAASCTDGKIYMYEWLGEDQAPKFARTIDGVVQRLEGVHEATSKCFWHPDGRVFATANASREIVLVDADSGAVEARFAGGHDGKVTSIAWSPNGALLASAGLDDSLTIWDARTQKALRRQNYEKILCVEWHPKGENLLCWTNAEGECYIVPGFLTDAKHIELLNGAKAGPSARSAEQQQNRPQTNGHAKALVNGRPRAGTPDSLDAYIADADDDYAWIEDDDGAGYKNSNGKRSGDDIDDHSQSAKRGRHAYFQPQVHQPFQPSSTPWKGNRKYLCLNFTGHAWTVTNDTHNTITVEFFDKEMHKGFKFTDPFQYDKACLNEEGALFSCPPNNGQPAMIFYRPHETWTNRADFRISLSDGEDVSCIGLSTRYIVACTTLNYVRVWTLFGTPVKIWRLKSSPAVTCAAHGDHVMVVANGAVGSDGATQLTYNIDDIRHGITHQSEDLVALGSVGRDDMEESTELKSLFWSDTGDPCVYDSSGTLLLLAHWRNPGNAKWIPILDTRRLARLADGKKQETYWPVAVADEKFHCVVLKGAEQYPQIPSYILEEFDLEIPVGRPIKPKKASNEDDEDEETADTAETNANIALRLEEQYVRTSLLHSLLSDVIESHGEQASSRSKTELARQEIEVDKLLLQLLAVECREGEDRGMKALEVVKLLTDRSGRMVEAAGKVAGRWGRTVLEDKIREYGEGLIMGRVDEN